MTPHAPAASVWDTVSSKEIDYARIGSSVRNGVIRYTSVSQITTFNPRQYGGCPRKWWLVKVARLKEPQTTAQETGIEIHRQIETYLATGEDILGIVARAGMRFIPKPGPGIDVEVPFGDEDIVETFDAWRAHIQTTVDGGNDGADVDAVEGFERTVLDPLRPRYLVASDVPLIGKIDVINTRGEWLDDAGIRRPEPGVVELLDWKTSSNIEAYAKGGDDLADTVQMVGYAKYASQVYPGIEKFRLSHGYFQTRGAPRARKVTCLISLDTVERLWQDVERVVNEMKHVARESDVSKVPPNLEACAAYRGCFFADKCPRSPKTAILAAIAAADPGPAPERVVPTMSILNSLLKNRGNAGTPATPPAPAPAPVAPPPAAPTPAVNATVAAEIARLQAEEAAIKLGAPTPPASAGRGTCPTDGAALTPENSSRLPNGSVVHTGCAPAAAGVLPPDAPASAPPTNAKPVSPEEKAALSPAVQAAVTQWETAGASPVPAPTAAAPEAAPTAPTPAVETPAKRGPGRLRKNPTPAAEPIATPPPVDTAATPPADDAPPAVDTASVTAEPPPLAVAMTFSGRVLFVDTVVSGVHVGDFAGYVDSIARELCAEYNAADLRCAPTDGPLAFGKWKGALAAAIRARPPAVGLWGVTHAADSEVMTTAIDAVRPLCSAVVRGVR